jgi:hypothetical protein
MNGSSLKRTNHQAIIPLLQLYREKTYDRALLPHANANTPSNE